MINYNNDNDNRNNIITLIINKKYHVTTTDIAALIRHWFMGEKEGVLEGSFLVPTVWCPAGGGSREKHGRNDVTRTTLHELLFIKEEGKV